VWYLFKGFNLSVKVIQTDRQTDRQRGVVPVQRVQSVCEGRLDRQTDRETDREVWYLFKRFNLSVKVV